MTPTRREHARNLYNSALALLKSGTDPVMSYRQACSAVETDPAFADGWRLLGGMLSDMGHLPASIACYRKGLACEEGNEVGQLNRPLKFGLLVNLGHKLLQLGSLNQAGNITQQAIQMFIDDPDGLAVDGAAAAITNRSLICSHMENHEGAVLDAKWAFSLCQDPVIQMGLAFAHLFAGDLAEGLRHFERRFDYKLVQYLNLPYPKWDGGYVETLIVMPCMGLGDSLSMARFLPQATERAGRVILQCQPELVGLLQGWFPSNVEIVPQTHELPPADAWTSVFSLPTALGLTTEEIRDCPGLRPDFSKLAVGPIHGQMKPENFNVVFAYAGAPASDIDAYRSIKPTEFLPLLDVPGVKLWSIQVGPRVKELHEAGMAALVQDVSPWIRDARDTAAIMLQADLVITVESFVGHLAGALGVECWVLCSKLGRDWRTGASRDKPLWYGKSSIFRQGDDRSWPPVMKRVVEALREKLNARMG